MTAIETLRIKYADAGIAEAVAENGCIKARLERIKARDERVKAGDAYWAAYELVNDVLPKTN